ncbi:MAG: aldo/keto reductase [Bacilli bacterium]|jgi:hypothetical protein|nr:aldo/keto reductase [Bacilli bacterium]MBS6561741.1 aldo/keto reductase [Staphylococcus sp.]CDC72242.1 putative uncharacterized protein [Staphylococcus sp. CAG:324]
MIYRKFDKLDIKTSLLGFGCMRFPTLKDGKIDETKAEQMIDLAIKNGVNYIDTAYPYHNGDSEPFLGKILNKYPRNSYFLATKLPIWAIENKDDVYRIFDEQLQRLETEYIDFYLLHAMNKDYFAKVKELGIIEICEEFRKEGKIKYLGFSFHDSYEVFDEILNHYHWDFCQIQFNYMDTEIQAGLKGYELAKAKDIPLIVMEPIKGGLLAKLPKEISMMFSQNGNRKSDSSYALRYIASFDHVKVILSGMSTLEQVEDNLDTFNNYTELSKEEHITIEKVVSSLKSRLKNGCTGCRYCMPCPYGVDIPNNFAIWNQFGMYDNKEIFENRMIQNIKNGKFIDKCVKCGKCEKRCPQHLSIRKDFERLFVDYNDIKSNS